MSDALELRAEVRSLLQDEGRAVTLQRSTAGAYDPATGAGAAPATAPFTGLGRIGNYRDSLVDGTLIKRGDRQCTFQPDDWTYVPAPGDVMTAPAEGVIAEGGVKLRELGGTPISYTLQLRK